MIPYKQLSLADVFTECQEVYDSDKPLHSQCGKKAANPT